MRKKANNKGQALGHFFSKTAQAAEYKPGASGQTQFSNWRIMTNNLDRSMKSKQL